MRLKFGLLLIFFCASIVNAQDDLSGNLIFTPYPSPYLSDWETNPTSLGQLTIINNNGSTDDVRVRAIVTKQDREEVFRSVTNPIPLNGSPVQDVDNTTLISFSDASYSDDEFRRIVQMTGRLLEGEYTVCLTIEKLTGECRQPAFVLILQFNIPMHPGLCLLMMKKILALQRRTQILNGCRS